MAFIATVAIKEVLKMQIGTRYIAQANKRALPNVKSKKRKLH